MSTAPHVFRLRTWLQLALLPLLVVMLGGTSAWLILDLRKIILAGFDQKLVGASAVVAASLDPAEHAWLMELRTWDRLIYDEAADVFWGEETTHDPKRWVAVRAEDGVEVPAGELAPPSASIRAEAMFSAGATSTRPEGATAVAWDSRRARWVAATDQLRAYDAEANGWTEGDFAAAFGREDSAVYRDHAGSFQRIRQRLGLSYLYTQVVSPDGSIHYGLDGSIGDDHSPLLSPDELPSEELPGVQQMMREGTPHFTQLQRWELWGLIKSGFVPIFDVEGRAVSMVGADVEVSTIERQTRQALLLVFALSILVMALASAWTLRVSARLRRPMEVLKRGALLQAVGEGGEVEIKQPAELRALATQVNRASARLREARSQLEQLQAEQTQRHDANTLSAALPRWLSAEEDASLAWPVGVSVTGGPGLAWIWREEQVLVWLAAAKGEGDARRASDLGCRLQARLEADGAPGTDWPRGVVGLVRVRPDTREVVVLDRIGMSPLIEETQAERRVFRHPASGLVVALEGYTRQGGEA